MRKTKTLQACCQKFARFAINYCDSVVKEDAQLQTAVSALLRVSNDAPLSQNESLAIGVLIEVYLEKKKLRDHYCFNRSLSEIDFEHIDYDAGLMELKTTFK